MGKELASAFPAAQAVFQEVDETLGFPISQIAFQGPKEVLDDTINTQPAIFAASIACLRELEASRSGLAPALVSGHSLGEYTALVAAGAFSLAHGLQLVKERGRLMKQAGEMNPGGMAAVLGLEDTIVEAIVQEVDNDMKRLAVANYNSPGQVVISGETGALEEAMRLAQERGASRVLRLAVSIAAHSPLMAFATAGLADPLHQIPIQEAKIPIIANVHAQPITKPEEIRQELLAQLLYGVQWTKTVQRMVQEGVTTFIEVGPGRVLSGLVKRIHPQAKVLNISDPKSLEKTLSEIA